MTYSYDERDRELLEKYERKEKFTEEDINYLINKRLEFLQVEFRPPEYFFRHYIVRLCDSYYLRIEMQNDCHAHQVVTGPYECYKEEYTALNSVYPDKYFEHCLRDIHNRVTHAPDFERLANMSKKGDIKVVYR